MSWRRATSAILLLASGSHGFLPSVKPWGLHSVALTPEAHRIAPTMLPQQCRGPSPRAALLMTAKSPSLPSRTPLAGVSTEIQAASKIQAIGSRFLRALLTTIVSLLGLALRAVAAVDRSTPVGPSLVISGNMVKWGGLGAVFGLAYILRPSEKPAIVYTEDTPPQQATSGTESNTPRQTSGEDTGALDDAAIFGSLRQRMQELAQAKDEESSERDPEGEVASDSADGWGMGSTAVLEPPKDDAARPSLEERSNELPDFPPGFPLRGNDDWGIEAKPTASEEQIAMLKRMFGTEE